MSKTRKAPQIKLERSEKLSMEFPLEAEQVAAIKKCIEGGNLKIVVDKVDLGTGRVGDGWLYD